MHALYTVQEPTPHACSIHCSGANTTCMLYTLFRSQHHMHALYTVQEPTPHACSIHCITYKNTNQLLSTHNYYISTSRITYKTDVVQLKVIVHGIDTPKR
jgi:hypothetical protein